MNFFLMQGLRSILDQNMTRSWESLYEETDFFTNKWHSSGKLSHFNASVNFMFLFKYIRFQLLFIYVLMLDYFHTPWGNFQEVCNFEYSISIKLGDCFVLVKNKLSLRVNVSFINTDYECFTY